MDSTLTLTRRSPVAGTQNDERQQRLEAFADSVLVTTTAEVQRHRIARHLGVESIDVEIEGAMISELTAEFHDLLGYRSSGAGSGVGSLKHAALRRLTLRAAALGANAILEAELTYQGHSGTRARFTLSGTLVELVPE